MTCRNVASIYVGTRAGKYMSDSALPRYLKTAWEIHAREGAGISLNRGLKRSITYRMWNTFIVPRPLYSSRCFAKQKIRTKLRDVSAERFIILQESLAKRTRLFSGSPDEYTHLPISIDFVGL